MLVLYTMNPNSKKIEKMFDLMMKIVVVYSFERVKIRQIYAEECAWYEEKNLDIEVAADRFLSSHPPRINIEKISIDTMNFEKEFKQQLVQYFWNYHQYGSKPNNIDVFESLGYKQDQIHDWIVNTHIGFYPDARLRALNPAGFVERYNIYSFLVPDQFEQIFFKYYKILKLLEDSKEPLLTNLMSLLSLIPYYSPYSMQAFTELENYRSQHLNKKHFSVFHNWFLYGVQAPQCNPIADTVSYLSLEHEPIALIDTILQFLLKHLHHLIRWHFFNYEMTELHSEKRIQENVQKGELRDLEQLDQVTRLAEAMFTALPKNQKTIYDFVEKKKSIETIMHSLMLFYFEAKYIKEHKIQLVEVSNSENLAEPKFSRSDKKKFNKAFFKFLEKGFEKVEINVKSKTEGKFDTWHLTSDLFTEGKISGGSIRSNAINHRKLLN
ncbi:hypothetical protein B9T34_02285 [Acinetobacter sp. ANC 3813]|nr:hypothetical protein B9T34_02285 [Acinetobacter sp. ANC 3813]